MPTVGIGAISRCVGYAAVAAAIVAAALHFRQDPKPLDPASAAAAASTDRLARELAHCQSLGMAAKDDTACAAAWGENRRRFFTDIPSHSPPSPSAKVGRPQ